MLKKHGFNNYTSSLEHSQSIPQIHYPEIYVYAILKRYNISELFILNVLFSKMLATPQYM